MPNRSLSNSIVKDPVTWLYPPIEPYNTGRLQVSPIHELNFEESGNPSGKPVIFLHGGPGGGSDPKQRRFFHPEKYRIVNFDQRGCGKSTPYASLEANTTWDLVADIEQIREHLAIDRWQVFGGSWDLPLPSLILKVSRSSHRDCASRHLPPPQAGTRLVLPAWRVCDLSRRLGAVSRPHPGERGAAILSGTTAASPAMIRQCGSPPRRSGAVGKVSHPNFYRTLPSPGHYEGMFALAFARIEVPLFPQQGFFETDDQLLRDASRIRHIPGVIVQGRYDVVCPMEARGPFTVPGPRRSHYYSRQWPQRF
jgi:proline iminopeptidase